MTILNDRDIIPIVRTIGEKFTGLLRISVDAYYSTHSNATVFDRDSGEVIVKKKTNIIYPNSWGSVNCTEFLRSPEDLDELIKEIQPAAFKDAVLKNTFFRRDVYATSNVRVGRILAYQIQVLSYPAAWLFK